MNCSNILECLLITFEHEFTHAFIGCFCFDYGRSRLVEQLQPDIKGQIWKGEAKPSNGHSHFFMTIVNKKFGHTKYKHNLFTETLDIPAEYEQLIKNSNTDEIKKN